MLASRRRNARVALEMRTVRRHEAQVLGAHPQYHGLRIVWWRGKRVVADVELERGGIEANPAVAKPKLSRDEVHARRSQESGHEDVGGTRIDPLGPVEL